MQFAINGIKKGLRDFADKLKDSKIDARVAFLGFRDIQADRFTRDAFVVFLDGQIVKKDYQEFELLLRALKTKKSICSPRISIPSVRWSVSCGRQAAVTLRRAASRP